MSLFQMLQCMQNANLAVTGQEKLKVIRNGWDLQLNKLKKASIPFIYFLIIISLVFRGSLNLGSSSPWDLKKEKKVSETLI